MKTLRILCRIFSLLLPIIYNKSVFAEKPVYWIDPSVPSEIRIALLSEISDSNVSELRETADCIVDLADEISMAEKTGSVQWIYVVAAPYATVTDEIPSESLLNIWQGEPDDAVSKLILDRETYEVFSKFWGEPDKLTVETLPENELLSSTWKGEKTWAIIPFPTIDPRWKIIKVDGISPLDFEFDPDHYPLKIEWNVTPAASAAKCKISLPDGNFDPEKLTSLTLTGTTALVRQMAYHIEEDGLLYPVENIAETLSKSDITHISNEVSFTPDCPPAVPLRREARFCSDPSYISILKAVGADVIELTGNHVLDWGYDPFLYSLDLYDKEGMKVYGGGVTAEKGQEPVFFEHHGNRIAILGCNAVGPENILGTADLPGAAPCDLEKMKTQISDLRKDGWMVVVTFQHLEYDYYDVVPLQSHDFFEIAGAGPVIVSGSQAHIPQGMTFVDQTFIHFGLGNLLFDQMSDVERDSFFDRHYFYNGKYIGNILETIRLENYSQPRFLKGDERSSFLNLILNTCSWDKAFQ
ncbi:MAG: CapA family protein [Flexilinea sp.]